MLEDYQVTSKNKIKIGFSIQKIFSFYSWVLSYFSDRYLLILHLRLNKYIFFTHVHCSSYKFS